MTVLLNIVLTICLSVSLSGSERLAGEDGCNSGYCFGASESFVSKISVFFEYDVRWCMS